MKKILLSLTLVLFTVSLTMAQSESQTILANNGLIDKIEEVKTTTSNSDIQISNNVIIKNDYTVGKNQNLIVNNTTKSSQVLYIAPVSPIYTSKKTLYKEETLVVKK